MWEVLGLAGWVVCADPRGWETAWRGVNGRALLSVECSELGRLAALCLGSVGVGAGTGCGVVLSSRTRTAHLASGLSCTPRGQRALSAALPEVRLDSPEVRMTWGSFWVSRLLQQSLGAWPGPVDGSG